MDINTIAKRFFKLKKEVENYDKHVKIVVVTKYVEDVNILKGLFEIGIIDIAENYAQKMEYKFNALKQKNFTAEKYNWHFIGHLQKNKVKKVLPIVEIVQSIDSIELAKKINQEASSLNKVQKCLIELKISEEETKFGVQEDKIYNFVEELNCMNTQNIKICGLMTMAPYFENPEYTRSYFKKAYKIFSEIKKNIKDFEILSMGMSNDYKVALEEGSNMIRIGSLLFKE